MNFIKVVPNNIHNNTLKKANEVLAFISVNFQYVFCNK